MRKILHHIKVLLILVIIYSGFLYVNVSYSQWQQTNGPIGGYIYVLATNGTDLFAGTNGGILKYPSGGPNWISKNNGLTCLDLREIIFIGTNIFAATYQTLAYQGGVFLSTNNGDSWTSVNNGLTNRSIVSLKSNNGSLYAGTTAGGLYTSTNNGTSWTLSNSGLPNYNITGICFIDDSIYVSTYGDGVYKSTNNGTSWIRSNTGIGSSALFISSITTNNAFIFAGTDAGVYRSTNYGLTWVAGNSGLTNCSINRVYASPAFTNIYACTHGAGIFVSSDYGLNWTPETNGLTNLYVNPVIFMGSGLYLGSYGAGIFSSSDGGNNWTSFNSGLINTSIYSLHKFNSTLFAGTFASGIFKSTDNCASWFSSNLGNPNLTTFSFADDGTNIYSGTYGSGIFKSVNNGASWTALGTTGLANLSIPALLITSGYIFAGTSVAGVFLSKDGGNSWTDINNGLPALPFDVRSLTLIDNTIFVSLAANGIYSSSNSGSSWNAVNNGLPVNKNVNTIVKSGSTLFAGGSGIYISNDNGNSWTVDTIGLTNKYIRKLFVIDNSIYAGSNGDGVYLQTGSGTNWSNWRKFNDGLVSVADIRDIEYIGDFMFSGLSGNGVWKINIVPLPVKFISLTSNVSGRNIILNWKTSFEKNNSGFDIERKISGTNEWKKISFVTGKGNSNVPVQYTYEDKKLNCGKYNYRFKQIDYNGNFEYFALNGEVEISNPGKFILNQNYPNPFNPKTKIDFELPVDCKVTLKVYDITGRDIVVLLNNEFKKTDYYTIEFDGSRFSSGLYFYRLITDGFSETKKMILLK